MFCHKCGVQLMDGVAFCSKCGASVQGGEFSSGGSARQSQAIANNRSYSDVSSKWAWMIAIIPIFILLIVPLFGLYPTDRSPYEYTATPFVFMFISFVVVCFLLYMDNKELARNGITNIPFWIGILLIPAYLFLRASNTNKKYGYAVVWSILFAFYAIIYFYFVVLQN